MDNETKKKQFRKAIARLGLMFVVVLLVCTYFSKAIENALLPTVVTAAPYSGRLSYPMTASAEVSYTDGWIVYAQSDMRIEFMYLEDGGTIKIDSPIARINPASGGHAAEASEDTEENLLMAGVSGYLIQSFLEEGMLVKTGDPLFQYAPAGTTLKARWTCAKETGQHFTKGHLVDYTYLSHVLSSNVPQKFSGSASITNAYFDSGQQLYTFEIVFSTTPEALTPDSALVIDTASISPAYDCLLPSRAIAQGTTPENGTVYLLDEAADNQYTVHSKKVTILASNDLLCAVSGDFSEDDQIIVSSTAALSDGQRVRLR